MILAMAGAALLAMAAGAAQTMATTNLKNQNQQSALIGTAYSRKQFNFKRSGSDIKPGSAKAHMIALKYGGKKSTLIKKDTAVYYAANTQKHKIKITHKPYKNERTKKT